jgi:Flp pilus assembly protein TadD
MSESAKLDDVLLRRLLERTEDAPDANEKSHVDVESIALFASRELHGEGRDKVVAHLAECAACRQTVSELTKMQSADVAPIGGRPANRSQILPWRNIVVALAACLLLACGWFFVSRGRLGPQLAEARAYDQTRNLIEQGQFSAAQAAIAAAGQRGVSSGRLQSLLAQSMREIPSSIALRVAGRLTQFGYEIGGGMIKSLESPPGRKEAEKALAVLDLADSTELEVVLNRGHTLLTLGEDRRALVEFTKATELAPSDSNAWLGRGMATFKLDDFQGAEEYFNKSLSLDSANTAAEINLALVVDKLGRTSEAIDIWRQLLKKPLSENDRQMAQQAILTLESKL